MTDSHAFQFEDGHCPGPLFAPSKIIRELARPPGKQGIVHRLQTKRATPKWLTKEQAYAIRSLYNQAKYLTAKTGELHVVDHIVPKIGGTVCGLHVPWNLRVIHWRENATKGAAWWPDMWMIQLELL